MTDKLQGKSNWSVTTNLVSAPILLASYFVCYVLGGTPFRYDGPLLFELALVIDRGTLRPRPPLPQVYRNFPYRWQAKIFIPAGFLESKIFGRYVGLRNEPRDPSVPPIHTFHP